LHELSDILVSRQREGTEASPLGFRIQGEDAVHPEGVKVW
jgi:hypothetical protein